MWIWIVSFNFDGTAYGFSTKEKALDFIQTYINAEHLTKELVWESSRGSGEYDLYYKDDSGTYLTTVNIYDYRLDSGEEM